MPGDDYFVLTALPVLDPPGSTPPLALPEFLGWLPAGAPLRLAQAVLLEHDLQLREAVLAGELQAPAPAVLTAAQLAGQEPLPPELAPAEAAERAPAFPADAVWEAYYRHAAAIARELHSPFLQQWLATGVRLRNDLARERAHALGLKSGRYLVALELESSDAEVEGALTAWLDAPDPLSGLRALIAARWRWIEQHEPRYTFATDEYAAYAAKLALLHRWQRTAGEPPVSDRSGGVAR